MLVEKVMSTHLITVDKEETVAAAARLLSRHNIGALPVTSSDGRLVGMLTDRDIAVRCVAANFDPNITRVRTIMSSSPVTVHAGASAAEAAKKMSKHRICRMPVTEQGKMVGLISQGDFAAVADSSAEAALAFLEVSGSHDSVEPYQTGHQNRNYR